jgi:hypothetical protein
VYPCLCKWLVLNLLSFLLSTRPKGIAADVVIQAMTGGDHKLYDPLFRNMILAGALEGTLYFAMDNSDVGTLHEMSRLVGVSVWFQPGRTLNSRCALLFR